jgi:hypothetical protein
MKTTILLLLLASVSYGQDLSYRVRREVLDQRYPVTVNASTHGVTTLQFPSPIESLEGDGFTQKPSEESGDFYISPGLSWVSVRSLHPGAAQNLGVVISGRVYEVMIDTVPTNDLSVIFEFPRAARQQRPVWSPLINN